MFPIYQQVKEKTYTQSKCFSYIPDNSHIWSHSTPQVLNHQESTSNFFLTYTTYLLRWDQLLTNQANTSWMTQEGGLEGGKKVGVHA